MTQQQLRALKIGDELRLGGGFPDGMYYVSEIATDSGEVESLTSWVTVAHYVDDDIQFTLPARELL